MPVLQMFCIGAQPEAITNEPEYWTYFRARPADDPQPTEKAHWDVVRGHWETRQAHPELKSGSLLVRGAGTDDPAVFVAVRDLLRPAERLPRTSAAALRGKAGYTVSLPARDGRVIKLC